MLKTINQSNNYHWYWHAYIFGLSVKPGSLFWDWTVGTKNKENWKMKYLVACKNFEWLHHLLSCISICCFTCHKVQKSIKWHVTLMIWINNWHDSSKICFTLKHTHIHTQISQKSSSILCLNCLFKWYCKYLIWFPHENLGK